MSGAVLAVSAAPARREAARAALAELHVHNPHWVPGEGLAGDTDAELVRIWRRPDGFNVDVTTDSAASTVRIGSGVMCEFRISAGGATVRTDAMSYGTVFGWHGDGIAALSTRVDLLAQLASALGEAPTKDLQTAELLAFIRFPTPSQTGYREIRALAPGEQADIEAGRLSFSTDPAAVGWDRRRTSRPLDDLVATAADEICRTVRAAIEGPGPCRVDLTAGLDTRLVLAGLLAIDAARDVEYQTIGGRTLNDVRVAEARAAQLGLRHEAGFPYPPTDTPLAERFAAHARITSGMSNPKDGLRVPQPLVGHRRVSGLFGELLRGWRTMGSRTIPSRRNADVIAERFGAAKLALLTDDAAARAAERVRDEIVDPADPERLGWHAAHRFYATNRLRSRACRIDDTTAEARAYPLLSATLVEAGLDAMWHHPEAPFDDLIVERLAPILLEPPPPLADHERLDAPVVRESGKPGTIMQQALVQQRDERHQVFATLVDRDSDAWSIIDHGRFAAAVDRYDELNNRELALIHGAAVGIEWLSRD